MNYVLLTDLVLLLIINSNTRSIENYPIRIHNIELSNSMRRCQKIKNKTLNFSRYYEI